MSAGGKQDVFEKAGMDVAEAYFRALGGALVEVKIMLEEDKSTLADALAAHIDLHADWIGLPGKAGVLTIEAEDESWSLVFPRCVLVPVSSSLPGDTGAATVRRTLQFVSSPPIYTEP